VTMHHADVVVIGCGVTGSSVAYHLAKQGVRVYILERAEYAREPVASWASAGGVRRQGRHPAEAQLASEAIKRWQTLEEELEFSLDYRQGGNLLLAETEQEVAQLVTFVREQQQHGFSDVRLVDRREALELAPGLNQRALAGSYSPRDGQADPCKTVHAFVTAAMRHGAVYRSYTPVQSLVMRQGRVVGVQVGDEVIEAGHVVLATGAWSDELAGSIGVHLLVRTVALQMVCSTPAPALTLRPVLSAVGRALSLKQLDDGSFLIGGGWQGKPGPDRNSYILQSEHVQGNWDTARELLPVVGQQQIARAWCGLEARSIDDIPFIGSFSHIVGLTIACGFSGHGFALSPAVGRCVADHVLGRPTPELAGLQPARITQFQSEQIHMFMAG
jgi:sarcosine oxidase, subunit beta